MNAKSPETMNHTPGPWYVGNLDQCDTVFGYREGKPYSSAVAECTGYRTEREANARLIAHKQREVIRQLVDRLGAKRIHSRKCDCSVCVADESALAAAQPFLD